jgi:hypothetical protein
MMFEIPGIGCLDTAAWVEAIPSHVCGPPLRCTVNGPRVDQGPCLGPGLGGLNKFFISNDFK